MNNFHQHGHKEQNHKAQRYLFWGALFLVLAVMLGAFGAHALKKIISPDKLITFETGIRYQFYHGLSLLIVGLLQQQFPDLCWKKVASSFIGGIFFFSFNCYLYAVTEVKTFAMLVPIGGILFILGWIFFLLCLKNLDKKKSY